MDTSPVAPAPPRSTRKRPRRPRPVPSNTLLLVLPPLLFSDALLPLFHAHFHSYGTLLSWTPLERLGRVVAVYDDDEGATEAKNEMDGFVWEDEHERDPYNPPQPLRVYYGPPFTISHLPSSSAGPSTTSQVLLTVPSSGKNFLISPPGSPPVGWEQTEEDKPNQAVFHPDDGIRPVQIEVDGQGTFSDGWADELARALRFLSVDSGGGESDDEEQGEDEDDPMDDSSADPDRQTTQLVLPPLPPLSSSSIPRPAVTVSSPPPSDPSSTAATPGGGKRDITQVKATLESMLGRKRSMSELNRRSRSSSVSSTLGEELGPAMPSLAPGLGGDTGPRITPTARPPLA
ncbi:hypothetical protein JCM8097_005844 [Rhodosporidiobolus ruineniae]